MFFLALNEKSQVWVWCIEGGIATPVQQAYAVGGDDRVRLEDRYQGINKFHFFLWVGERLPDLLVRHLRNQGQN